MSSRGQYAFWSCGRMRAHGSHYRRLMQVGKLAGLPDTFAEGGFGIVDLGGRVVGLDVVFSGFGGYGVDLGDWLWLVCRRRAAGVGADTLLEKGDDWFCSRDGAEEEGVGGAGDGAFGRGREGAGCGSRQDGD